MAALYCMQCGGATHYSVTKPDNCSKCKRSFVIAAAPQVAVSNSFKSSYVEPEKPKPEELLKKYNIEPVGEDEIIVGESSVVRFNEIMRNPDAVNVKREGKRSRRSKKAQLDEFFNEGK